MLNSGDSSNPRRSPPPSPPPSPPDPAPWPCGRTGGRGRHVELVAVRRPACRVRPGSGAPGWARRSGGAHASATGRSSMSPTWGSCCAGGTRSRSTTPRPRRIGLRGRPRRSPPSPCVEDVSARRTLQAGTCPALLLGSEDGGSRSVDGTPRRPGLRRPARSAPVALRAPPPAWPPKASSRSSTLGDDRRPQGRDAHARHLTFAVDTYRTVLGRSLEACAGLGLSSRWPTIAERLATHYFHVWRGQRRHHLRRPGGILRPWCRRSRVSVQPEWFFSAPACGEKLQGRELRPWWPPTPPGTEVFAPSGRLGWRVFLDGRDGARGARARCDPSLAAEWAGAPARSTLRRCWERTWGSPCAHRPDRAPVAHPPGATSEFLPVPSGCRSRR